MKTSLLCIGLATALAIPASLAAQASQSAYGFGGAGQTSQPGYDTGHYRLNHAEVGVYADYFRFAPAASSTNYVGVGGRVAFNVQPNLAIEGEMNYDFARNFTTTTTTNNGTTTTTTFVTTGVRPMTGLFGPKLQFGTSSPFRVFATGKIGFLNFSATNPNHVTQTQFVNAVDSIGGTGTHLAFYPGGGFETFLGPIGLRAEAGDEIYLNSGVYNNLRVTAGPTLRF